MTIALLALHPLWITFGPVLVINALFACSLTYFALTGKGERHKAHEAARRNTSRFLNLFFKEWWIWATDPVALFLAKLHIGPNLVTFTGFLVSCGAALLFSLGHFGYAGWTMVLGATFDTFDGRVARLTGQVSRSGAFFDSVMDRFGEAVCFLGLAYHYRTSWTLLAIVAGLIGSMLVSYTRARGQAVGIDCTKGSMQRAERIVYLGVGSIFQPVVSLLLLPFSPAPPAVTVIGAIIIIAVMTNATAIYRMIYIMNALDSADRRGPETIPQIITKLSTPEGRVAFWEERRQRPET